ncbi:kelch-like protein 42 [Corythoichthys intestinalis]|uniref:kelch-like protein 42 n=1 Tax=Corythoichthys intestinalis TaxID=161448 RepID=UPI0025A5F280|nr:kelch-like protein 42 [Corythoichthys intestinalis]XP_061809206.1 kelch-like protein 42 [Nerophis lumbriciformis]
MSSEPNVAIVTEDKTYAVSKRKLIEKSDYFRALYNSGMRESTEDSVQLQGLSAPGLELVLEFIDTSKVELANETLEDLIEAASFLQVTSILKPLTAEIRPDNCVELYGLAEVYGTHELSAACLKFMSCYYHPMMRRPEFYRLPAAVRERARETRMNGAAALVIIRASGGPDAPDRDQAWSMLRYGEADQRWKPLANNLPADLINVRGYGSAVLDNYLFVVGGWRASSQEISAAHCYNPCGNEWIQVAPLNQKRSNFKLLAAQGKLYAVGGQCLGTVECYSPENDFWTCVSSMPDPLVEFSACECQGMIYVMGGYTARARNTDLLRYCPAADAWTAFRPCVPHVRKQQMLSVEDTIYLVGGYTREPEHAGETEDALTVQSYNVTTGEWLRLKEKASKSGLNLTCALHNEGIYIMSRDVGLSTSAAHRVFLKYDIFSDAWDSFRLLRSFGHNMLLCSLYFPNVL